MNAEMIVAWMPYIALIWIVGSALISVVGFFHDRYGNASPYLRAYFVMILAWPIAVPMIFVIFPLAEIVAKRIIDPAVYRLTGRRKTD